MSDFTGLVSRMNAAVRDVFGDQVTFTPHGKPGESVSLSLDSGAEFEELREGAHAFGFAALSAFSQTPEKGDTVTVPSGTSITAGQYSVRDVRLDGEGGVELVLRFLYP